MPEQREWPQWWVWELDLTPHLLKRMEDWEFNEIDLRAMLEHALNYRCDVVEGRWVIEGRHNSRRWEIIVEPDELEHLPRGLPSAGAQRHLNVHGDNIGNVVQFMEREHKARFQTILQRIANKIPGISNIDTDVTADKRMLLRFNDGAFEDPFFAQQMSDGTLKIFAYLLMLEDPDPPPFICIEEPENGLYHKLLEALAGEFRLHATGRKGAPQIFVTTHQPYFVDALTPKEVWVLEKGEDGFYRIQRASELEVVRNLVAEGLPLGGLWYSDYLDAR